MAVIVRDAGRFAAHTTLDVPEKQVLLILDPPEGGVEYEHHVLLRRLDAARWVCLDTNLTVDAYNMNEEEQIIPLGRNSQFPIAGRPIRALDHVTADAMNAFRARAAQLADVLVGPMGGVAVATASSVVATWVFSDPAHPLFETPVPPEVLQSEDSFVGRKATGIVLARVDESAVEPRWTSAERVRDPDMTTWFRAKREGAGRDPRVLPMTDATSRGARGICLFRDAWEAGDSSSLAPASARFHGSAALPELGSSIAESGVELAGYSQAYFGSSLVDSSKNDTCGFATNK